MEEKSEGGDGMRLAFAMSKEKKGKPILQLDCEQAAFGFPRKHPAW